MESKEGLTTRNCYIFDDIKSIFHSFLGSLAKILSAMFPMASFLLTVLFIIYEVVEDREEKAVGRAKCDILEYILGYILADTLYYSVVMNHRVF